MKKFWCVTTKFFDSGRVKPTINLVDAEKKPENDFVENRMCDEYYDYFDSYEEARKFYDNAKKA